MIHAIIHICLLIAGCAYVHATEEEVYWPYAVFTPDTNAVNWHEADTSGFAAHSKSTIYSTVLTQNEISYAQKIGNVWLRQHAEYEFTQDKPKGDVHFIDASGDVLFRNSTIFGLHPGISWSPVISYRTWDVGALQSNIEIGPKLEGALAGLPCRVSAGLYNYIWNDSITPWLLSRTDGRYNLTPGVSGNFKIGNGLVPYRNLPLYFKMTGWARAAGGNNLGQFGGSVLYMRKLSQFGGDDSLYLQMGDSLTNGKKTYIGESSENTFVSNTSWRTDHSFSASAGIVFAERLMLRPRVYYRYMRHSIAYPAVAGSTSDIRNTGNTGGLHVTLRENRWVDYSGKIEVCQEFEDWLFKEKFGENEVPSFDKRDNYIINQTDHTSDLAKTDHDLVFKLPSNLYLRYQFSAKKNSKKYPFVYRENVTSEKRNENENDRIQKDNLFAAGLKDTLYNVEVYGKYGVLNHFFYHENRCAESKTSDEYRIGLKMEFDNKKFRISEHAYLDAEVSDYYFKRVGSVYNAAPPYSRDFSSALDGKLFIIDQLAINGSWKHLFSDNGYWYGNDYRPDSLQFTHEYYAIERKGTQYWLDFSAEYTFESSKVTAGTMLRDVFERRFNFEEQRYAISDLDIGYGIEPYLLLEGVALGTYYKLRLKRIFNTGDSERWKFTRNWDIALIMKTVF